VWLAFRLRTYADAMDAWQSHCLRFTLWESAREDGLVELDPGSGGMDRPVCGSPPPAVRHWAAPETRVSTLLVRGLPVWAQAREARSKPHLVAPLMTSPLAALASVPDHRRAAGRRQALLAVPLWISARRSARSSSVGSTPHLVFVTTGSLHGAGAQPSSRGHCRSGDWLSCH
jgi:hypothetical protein